MNDRLKETERACSSKAGTRFKNCLVIVEMSLALIVLVAAGLFGNSLLRVHHVDSGFDPAHVGVARIELSQAKYTDLHRAEAFYTQALERIRSIHAVEKAAASPLVPFGQMNVIMQYSIQGRSDPPGELPTVEISSVTAEYFETLSIPLVRGRSFSAQDGEDSLKVAVINQTMAQRYWPGADPVGQHILTGANRRDLTMSVWSRM